MIWEGGVHVHVHVHGDGGVAAALKEMCMKLV